MPKEHCNYTLLTIFSVLDASSDNFCHSTIGRMEQSRLTLGGTVRWEVGSHGIRWDAKVGRSSGTLRLDVGSHGIRCDAILRWDAKVGR